MKHKVFILPKELIAEIDKEVKEAAAKKTRKTPEIKEFLRLYCDRIGVILMRRLIKKHFGIDVPHSTVRDWRLAAKRENNSMQH